MMLISCIKLLVASLGENLYIFGENWNKGAYYVKTPKISPRRFTNNFTFI